VLLRRASLITVLLLVPLIFLPLRHPADTLVDRAVNVAIHVAVALLLFALTRRLGASALAAPATVLIFAVHPVHVDAIAVLLGRAEIQATLFSMAALLSFTYAGPWLRHGEIEVFGAFTQRAAAWSAGACLLLALGSSAVALSTPALLVGLEWLYRPAARFQGDRRWPGRFAALAPSAVALLAHFALRIRDRARISGVRPPMAEDDGLAGPLALLARKFGLLFYPVNLSAEPSETLIRPQTNFLHPLPWLGLAVLAILVWLAARSFIARSRAGLGTQASFAAMLFLLPYFATGGERRLYFASAGFCLLLGLTIGAVSTGWFPGATRRLSADASGSRVRLAALTLAVLILGFSILTWARCLEWREFNSDQRTTGGASSDIRRPGENGSSSPGGFPSTIQRER